MSSSNKTTLTCRVQYLNDVDPFSASTNFPEPPRPPVYTFNANIPLINQIAGVHRALMAPHRVSQDARLGCGARCLASLLASRLKQSEKVAPSPRLASRLSLLGCLPSLSALKHSHFFTRDLNFISSRSLAARFSVSVLPHCCLLPAPRRGGNYLRGESFCRMK